jgi:hypothetical protein
VLCLCTAIEFSFEEESYSTSEGGEVAVVVRKVGEVNDTLCVMVRSRDGTAVGKYVSGYNIV